MTINFPPESPEKSEKASEESDVAGAGALDKLEASKVRHVHWVSVFFLYTAALSVIVLYVIILLHALASDGWRWLKGNDLKFLFSTISPIMMSATVGSVSSLVMWYFFQKDTKRDLNS